jgi:hypothetical protein
MPATFRLWRSISAVTNHLEIEMQARLSNAQVIPEAMPAIMALTKAAQRGGVPAQARVPKPNQERAPR